MVRPDVLRADKPGELVPWLRANRQRLAARVIAELSRRSSEVRAAQRESAWIDGKDAIACRIDTLSIAVSASAPALFLDEVASDKVRLGARGIVDHHLELQLGTLRRVLEVELPGVQYAGVGQILDLTVRTYGALPTDLPSLISPGRPHGELARDYLDMLFAGDWRGACQLVVEAARRGVPVTELYLDVLQLAQWELGRRWQTNRISVADEHYCTAVTRQAIALLESRIFALRRVGRTLVATTVSGEAHELGVRMVADFFEIAGWDTFYVGADTPVDALLEMMVRRRADLVVLSASLTRHVPTIAAFVRAIRGRAETARAGILVGGRPFEIVPDLWESVGADGSATSAAGAVELGDRIVAGGRSGERHVH